MTRRTMLTDSLYGQVSLDRDISTLVSLPVLQRLRHVRLSNIDSLNMPGIANLSRFEHAIGVGHLSTQLGLYGRLSHKDRLALSASAFLHDWAITSFGHLMEEAFQYVGTEFDHEKRFHEIVTGEGLKEIGGVDKQILHGRQIGLRQWARHIVPKDQADQWLLEITEYIQGRGRYGRLISGDIDLDNIDGVYRMAFHMGLPIDRDCPVRLVQAVVDVMQPHGEPVFRRSAETDIAEWVSTRRAVYERLMLADLDFIGKLMLLYAGVLAFEKGEFGAADWSLTDDGLFQLLISSTTKEVKDAATRWRVGELWDATPLYWMHGPRPSFPELRAFSRDLSASMCRPCFAYAIKDKRNRLLNIHFDDSTQDQFGVESKQWLFGVGSPTRKSFRASESNAIISFAESYFNTSRISAVVAPWSTMRGGDDEECLL